MISFERSGGYKDKDIFEFMICLLHEDMFPQLKGYQDKASWCEGYLQQT